MLGGVIVALPACLFYSSTDWNNYLWYWSFRCFYSL